MISQGLMQPIGLGDMPNAKNNLNPGLLDADVRPGRRVPRCLAVERRRTGLEHEGIPQRALLAGRPVGPRLKERCGAGQWTGLALILRKSGVDIDKATTR